MKALRFYKISPGGNTTVLIMDSGIDKNCHAEMAHILMNGSHLHAEQVGYVNLKRSQPRLDMMGGEFCGNAARSLAAVLALEKSHFLNYGEDITGKIEVSGVNHPLSVRVKFYCGMPHAAVEMPIRENPVCIQRVKKGMNIVAMDGITHVLLDENIFSFPPDYTKMAAEICVEQDLVKEEAAGCIWYSMQAQQWKIKPVVWVRKTDSIYYETACGSGSVALGLYLAWLARQSIKTLIRQPSGQDISVMVNWDQEKQQFVEAWIDGPIKIIAKGETYIDR